jgi:dissimilatory sulfite reductase (desulfoviridin) alpha/beta subunit
LRGSAGTAHLQILEGKVEGVRKRGRPRDTRIKDMVNRTGMETYGESKRRAEDKDKWRLMVVNLRNEDDR